MGSAPGSWWPCGAGGAALGPAGWPLSRELGVGSPSPWARSVGVAEAGAEKGDFFFLKKNSVYIEEFDYQ